jgi:hypothetical protein
MGLLDRFGRRHDEDDEAGFVFGIGVDKQSLSEARKAGKRDGKKWVPEVGSPPPYIRTQRTRVSASMQARAKVATQSCESYGSRARRLINAPGDGNRDPIRLQLDDMQSVINEFDQDVRLAMGFLQELEKTYLEEAAPRWKRRGLHWDIPKFEHDEFLSAQRVALAALQVAAGQRGKHVPVDDDSTRAGEAS